MNIRKNEQRNTQVRLFRWIKFRDKVWFLNSVRYKIHSLHGSLQEACVPFYISSPNTHHRTGLSVLAVRFEVSAVCVGRAQNLQKYSDCTVEVGKWLPSVAVWEGTVGVWLQPAWAARLERQNVVAVWLMAVSAIHWNQCWDSTCVFHFPLTLAVLLK